MNTLELIGWIVFYIFGLGICAYILYTLIKWKMETEQAHIEYQKYLKSLIPGSMWIEREQHLPENPFESQDLQVVKVIETRMNHFGELWVRYMQQGHSLEASAYDFGKVYKIMEELDKLPFKVGDVIHTENNSSNYFIRINEIDKRNNEVSVDEIVIRKSGTFELNDGERFGIDEADWIEYVKVENPDIFENLFNIINKYYDDVQQLHDDTYQKIKNEIEHYE